jgi:hypothetical protein
MRCESICRAITHLASIIWLGLGLGDGLGLGLGLGDSHGLHQQWCSGAGWHASAGLVFSVEGSKVCVARCGHGPNTRWRRVQHPMFGRQGRTQ